MRTYPLMIALLFISLSGFSQDTPTDAEGCKDSPLFSRMTDYYISQCSSNYDELEVPMSSENTVTKEGTDDGKALNRRVEIVKQ